MDENMDQDMNDEPEPHSPLPIGASEPPRRFKPVVWQPTRAHFQPDPPSPRPGRHLHAFLHRKKEKKCRFCGHQHKPSDKDCMNSQGEEKTPRDMRELEEKRGNVDSGEQEIQSELVDRPPTFADVHAQATELQQESENNGKLPHIPSGKLDGETDPDSEKPRKRVKLGKCGESSLISLAPKQIGIAKWLTVTEVSTDYGSLVSRVADWARYFASPLMSNKVWSQKFARLANRNLTEVNEFKRSIARYPDISNACLYHRTDFDIITSLILRFLNQHLFLPVTNSQANVQPRGDQLAIRIRKAQAEAVRIGSPKYLKSRLEWIQTLTGELLKEFLMFGVLSDYQIVMDWCQTCEWMIIEPALALQEKFRTSPQQFRFDFSSPMRWNERGEIEADHTHFFSNLDSFDCINVLRHREKFSSKMLWPHPTKEELEEKLVVVMIREPSLYMRQFQTGNTVSREILVRRKMVLVAYGPRVQRERFLREVKPALMNSYRT